jgi:phage host-nuclease inhibitor protein Gam
MARTKITEISRLKSWDDVDLSLAEIGEAQRAVEKIEADMQASIDDIKLGADMEAKPHQDNIKELGAQIKLYVDAHRDELGNKKTKVLTFGSTGYRKSTKITLPKAASAILQIVMELRARGMTDCIVTPQPKIDKELLKKYPASEIVAAGAGVQVDDVFWFEIDREKLPAK